MIMLTVRQRHTGLTTRSNLGKTALAPEHACYFTAWAPVGQHLAVPAGIMFSSLSWLCGGKHLLANQVMVGTTPHPVLRFSCVFLTLCFVWSHFPERAGVDMKRFILFKSSGWASKMAGGVCVVGIIVYATKSGYQSSVPRHTWWKWIINSHVLSFDLHKHMSIFTYKISKTLKT